MRVLITGGAGFIGSHLCDLFIEKGHEVICVDNLLTGNLKNIEHLRRTKKFRFVRADVSERLDVSGKIDCVLHFASPASPVDYLEHPIETMKVGSLGTLNTLELARRKKAKYLMASTSEVYGDPLMSPQKENYWGNVNPVGPRSVYDEAKRFSEAMTMAYHRVYGVDSKIVRIFNTYGPRMRPNDGRAVPNFICQALKGKPITVYGKGDQTRSFCYVSDLVSGIYKLLMSNINLPVNIGNPHELTILELAGSVIRLSGSRSRITHKPLPEDDPKIRKPDIGLAKKTLKWSPQVPFVEGLKKTMEWFKK